MSGYYYLVDKEKKVQIKAGNHVDKDQFLETTKKVDEYLLRVFNREFSDKEPDHWEKDQEFRETNYDNITVNMLTYLNKCREFLRDAPQLGSTRLLAVVYYLRLIRNTGADDRDWDYYSEYQEEKTEKYKDYPILNE